MVQGPAATIAQTVTGIDKESFYKAKDSIPHDAFEYLSWLVEGIPVARGRYAIHLDAAIYGHLMRTFLQNRERAREFETADEVVVDIHPGVSDFVGISTIHKIIRERIQLYGFDMDVGRHRLRAIKLIARRGRHRQEKET